VGLPRSITVLLAMLLSTWNPATGHSLDAKYVPWGIDEYELFGLTKSALAQKFKGKLQFNEGFTNAWFFNDKGGPKFLLTFEDGCVATVGRVFVDGAGCNLTGPVLSSKRAALQFSIHGLLQISKRTVKEQQKVESAEEMLREIEYLQKPAAAPPK